MSCSHLSDCIRCGMVVDDLETRLAGYDAWEKKVRDRAQELATLMHKVLSGARADNAIGGQIVGMETYTLRLTGSVLGDIRHAVTRMLVTADGHKEG